MVRLYDLTWEQARDLERTSTVLILPVGAVEAHGPHLPLGTDGIIAYAMAREGAHQLEASGRSPVLLPAMDYSVASFAAGFDGTLSIRAETATALLVDLARSAGGQGFPVLAVANVHLDPEHLKSLHAATARAAQTPGSALIVFPDITRKPWALRLTDEFKSGACHAGQYESSVVMAEQPQLVREDVRRSLDANPASISAAIREGKRTFTEAGGPDAYFGFPADATVQEGRATVSVLGSILRDAVTTALREAAQALAVPDDLETPS